MKYERGEENMAGSLFAKSQRKREIRKNINKYFFSPTFAYQSNERCENFMEQKLKTLKTTYNLLAHSIFRC